MYLYNVSSIQSLNVGQYLDSQQNISFWLSSRQIKRLMRKLWQNIKAIFKLNNDGLTYFPLRLLKQQTQDFGKCCKSGFCQCDLEDIKLHQISMIEAELMVLHSAFKWIEHHISCKLYSKVKSIFVAINVTISEFKDNKSNDCESRITLFVKQLEKLLTELSDLLADNFASH